MVRSFFSDFKKFISRGSVIDLAVAVIIGAAFNKIISSFVADVLMPLLGIITGKVSLSALKWVIIEGAGENPGVIVSYGQFLQNIVDFLIIAFVVFVIVRSFNVVKDKLDEEEKKKTAAADKKKADEEKAAALKKAEEETRHIVEDQHARQEEYHAIIEIRDLLREIKGNK
ncbi:Large-conductance mechanosensitive channel [bioreactor metagenome]|uniref:Large-conductance mechanosensitive channel n=1 Tax=bioreactor metagenome TaxID=1076179 RepID=A0A644YK96_9ZZZZ|nr:large conductance mechanosensitive channel protein MscL [Oscillospiraceae bacterium]